MSEESYIPSQTPESEEVTTDYESSSLETPSESEYSIACSEDFRLFGFAFFLFQR